MYLFAVAMLQLNIGNAYINSMKHVYAYGAYNSIDKIKARMHPTTRLDRIDDENENEKEIQNCQY